MWLQFAALHKHAPNAEKEESRHDDFHNSLEPIAVFHSHVSVSEEKASGNDSG